MPFHHAFSPWPTRPAWRLMRSRRGSAAGLDSSVFSKYGVVHHAQQYNFRQQAASRGPANLSLPAAFGLEGRFGVRAKRVSGPRATGGTAARPRREHSADRARAGRCHCRCRQSVTALETGGTRELDIRVAGPAAQLVAKPQDSGQDRHVPATKTRLTSFDFFVGLQPRISQAASAHLSPIPNQVRHR
jgi:hypothetical protein